MESINALNKKRGSLKMRVTSFKNFLNNIKEQFPNDEIVDVATCEEIEQRLIRHTNILLEFERIQGSIDELTEDLKETIEAREKFESEYYMVLKYANNLLRRGQSTKVVPLQGQANEQRGIQQENSTIAHNFEHLSLQNNQTLAVQSSSTQGLRINQTNIPGVKLPIIELPKFKGYLSDWLKFRDTYKSIIHDNPNISNIQKFHYLMSSLEGSATQVIDEYEYTEQNYEIVWEALHRRYNDPKLLIHNHIEAMFKSKPILNESSEQLNEIVDSITKHTRALKKLEEPTEYWDSLLIYLIVTKLDVDTAREWEEQRLKLAEKPKLEDLLKCLRARATLLQTIERKKGIIKTKKITPGKTSTLLTKKVSCAFCKGEHYIQNCSNFLKLSPQERSERVKQLRLCTNCLRKGHYSKECTFGACRKCNSKHNSLLHFEKGDQSEAKESTAATMCAANHAKVLNEPNVIIATALVSINNSNKFKEQTRALLDSCSQSNFISERLCKKLKLEKIPIDVQVMSLNQAGPKINYKCEVEIVSRTSGFRFKTVCLVIPKLVDDVMPNEVIPLNDVQIPSHLKLADPSFQTPGQVDLLLGAQWFWEILCVDQIKLSNNLIMQKTRLGWIVGGPMSAPAQKIVKCNILKNVNLEQQLTKFWELEEAPITKAWSQEEKDCESYFVKTTRRNNDERFIVNMPLKESPKVLGESRHQAERRLINLEKRLKRTPELNSSYRAFLKEYEQLGHMTEVNESLTVPYVYYLPHHCVVKSESQTTKVRVVFDASASTTSGKSLNDIQMTGPVIQNDLFSIIIRFRKHAFIVSSDVTKMYRQVLIEEQRPLQRILWRENSEDPIKTFQLNTVTYGTTSGSFQAIRCLYQLGIECERNRPEIAKIIFNDFYVDDMLTGSDTKEGAISIAELVAQVLPAGGFKLQKWASNCSEVLNKIQEGKEALTNIQFTSDGQRKTLGVSWNTLADVLIYLVDVPKSKKITKRHILSVTSRIFDPLGLLAPCIIPAKIMLQKLWLEKLSWDESLPSELHNRWLQYSEQLTELNNLQILRQVVIKCYKSIQIHGFSDASKDAYGACIYVRSTDSEENVKVSLLCAKTRVAPLKTQTIPRLELCAAHALAKLVTTVVSALNTDIESITLWCDSTIVLSWIATQPNLLAVFESNRVARIQELTVGWAWRHVLTQENPADCLSRGATPREIQRDHMWWNGPTFLKKSSKDWPLLQTAEPIRQKTKSMLIKRTSENLVIDALFTKFSNLPKIVRIISYCRRFARRLKTKQATKGVISAEEYKGSLIELAKYSQLKAFQEEIELISSGKVNTKGRLTSLTPFLDDEKILRAGGRLKNSLFSMDKKHPIILAADQIFTKRLFEDMHIRLLHAGPSLLLASIREQFWPLGGRNLARRVVHACATCFRANPKSLQALMGHLPRARVSADFPFSITGVDYAGPFLIKDKKGRGCKIHKCYVSVFVCFVTKALHLELVSDLTKEAFIAALRRFVSRRGKPAHIYSDNGTTFVRSNNALIEFGKFIAKEVKNLSETIEDLGISWHFIPSYSPHFGGLWEAGVKATKYHLKRVAGNAHLTFEELCTLLAQVEALLNSRPLTPLSTDPNECAPLTPAHFLIGRTFISAPDPSLAHIKETRLSNWQRIQQLQQNFWERWNKEYISELQQRTKWKTPFPPLEINTLVLLKEDNLPPAKWRLGRVTEVHVGSDGIARVASVRTASGITRRAFPKLCPLPRDETLAHP